ncbi:hypothetical protein HAX54_013831 [Datura stramonium]|uniref:Uncharacterized protein n=1 Tax=Datura stramonium TaxID=4076 RepID=A0ABS8TNV1_DATST|nr:hypothetical protein [Datura stramonium]
MSGLLLGILCITKRGYQFRSFDSPAPSASSPIEQRSVGSHGYNDENLGEKARREAKQGGSQAKKVFIGGLDNCFFNYRQLYITELDSSSKWAVHINTLTELDISLIDRAFGEWRC